MSETNGAGSTMPLPNAPATPIAPKPLADALAGDFVKVDEFCTLTGIDKPRIMRALHEGKFNSSNPDDPNPMMLGNLVLIPKRWANPVLLSRAFPVVKVPSKRGRKPGSGKKQQNTGLPPTLPFPASTAPAAPIDL